MTEKVTGIRTGRISELNLPDSGKQCRLLAALARGAEELSYGKGWPDGVSDLIADLGQITGGNRVWLFQVLELSDKHMLMNFPFEWVDSQTKALKKNPRYDTKHWNFETCSLTYRTLVESRRRGEWQTATIKDLDECDFKDYQVEQGVQSTVSIPVYVQGEWWGLLGLDDCTRPYQWSDEEISLVRMTAHLISNAVLRNRLSSTNRQFEILSALRNPAHGNWTSAADTVGAVPKLSPASVASVTMCTCRCCRLCGTFILMTAVKPFATCVIR